MAVAGLIADATRGHLPLTWDALSQEAAFGDELLQQAVDVAQERLFGRVLATGEDEDFALRVIKYAGKLAALELIPAGIDYWMNQPTSESATGVNENHSFVDRAETLRKLEERLAMQIRKEEADIYALLGRAPIRNVPRPDISTPADDVLLTPDPRVFPRPFAAPRR